MMATVKASRSPPPTPPLKDIHRDTPSPETKDAVERPPRTSSPDNCPICLDEFDSNKDRAYSDNCFHIFCFECLLEWSNNKRECPLCKKAFKSINHKFKENGSHEVHRLPFIPPPPEEYNPISMLWITQMRQQYIRNRRQTERMRNDLSRPSSFARLSRNPLRPHTAERRRFLYQYELYCEGAETPGGSARYRRTTPDFYRSNPAVLHRLMPWLNRELVAILPSRDNVDYLQGHILDLIKRVDIRSPAFRNAISSALLRYTDQFIHEFHQFAMSPYDMATFDRHARYPVQPRGSRRPANAQSQSDRSTSVHNPVDSDVNVVLGDPTQPHSSSAVSTSSSHLSTTRTSYITAAQRLETRRWHRDRLAAELASARSDTVDLLSVPRRSRIARPESAADPTQSVTTGSSRTDSSRRESANEVSEEAGSRADVPDSRREAHGRRWDVPSDRANASNSTSELSISDRRERLTAQMRTARNRLERSMRAMENYNAPTDLSQRYSSAASYTRYYRSSTAAASLTENLMGPLWASPLASTEGADSQLTVGSNSLPRPPRVAPHVSALLSLPPSITSSREGGTESTRRLSESLGDSELASNYPGIVGRVRNFLERIDDRPINADLPNLSIPPIHDVFGDDDDEEEEVLPVPPVPADMPRVSRSDVVDAPFPFPHHRSSSSSSGCSSLSVDTSVQERIRSPSPASSHSSDVILVGEEKPFRSRTPIVVSDSEDDVFNAARNAEIPGSRRLSASSVEFSDECSHKVVEKRKSTAKHRRHHSVRLTQSSADEEDNVVPTVPHHARAMPSSSDSDCVITFEATKPKYQLKRTHQDGVEDRLAPKKKKLKKRKDKQEDKVSRIKSKKNKKEPRRKSKHHKHVLADVKYSIDRSNAATPESSSTKSKTKRKPQHSISNTSTSRAHTSSSSPIISNSSNLLSGVGSTGIQSSTPNDKRGVCLDPRQPKVGRQSHRWHDFSETSFSSDDDNLNNHTAVTDSNGRGNSTGSRSPTLDVTTVDSAPTVEILAKSNDKNEGVESMSPEVNVTGAGSGETNPSTADDDWYLDYSRNDYKHTDNRGQAPTDIRKQIRYFAKNKIAKKYEHKFKKHNKGHKN